MCSFGDKKPDSAAGQAIKSPAREKVSYCEADHLFVFGHDSSLFHLQSTT
jgi:hypothetical protein